jgi:hypothetical protein
MIKKIKNVLKKIFRNKLSNNGFKYDENINQDNVITIPVGNMSDKDAKKTLSELMKQYKDNIHIEHTTGNLSINGDKYTSTDDDENWIPKKDK